MEPASPDAIDRKADVIVTVSAMTESRLIFYVSVDGWEIKYGYSYLSEINLDLLLCAQPKLSFKLFSEYSWTPFSTLGIHIFITAFSLPVASREG